MPCPQGRQENPPDSNFCLGWGTRLALTCRTCVADLPGGSRFCNNGGAPVESKPAVRSRFASAQTYPPRHLAAKILSSRSVLEGERKQVTVLFADLNSPLAVGPGRPGGVCP